MNVYSLTKQELAEQGLKLAKAFLDKNNLPYPDVQFRSLRPFLGKNKPSGSYGCGMYTPRSRTVIVSPEDCAKPSVGLPMQWSFPGYTVDRTPMGVVAHEFGHYVDHRMIYLSKTISWGKIYKDEKVSSYEPDASEAFAETMRLMILNPAMLKAVAPNRYKFLLDCGLRPSLSVTKDALLHLRMLCATDRILEVAGNKVTKALRQQARKSA